MFEDVWIVNVDNWKLSIYFSSSSFHSFVERICRIGDFPLPKFDCKEQLKTQIFAGSGHRFMESSQAGTLGYTINYYGYIYIIYIYTCILYIYTQHCLCVLSFPPHIKYLVGSRVMNRSFKGMFVFQRLRKLFADISYSLHVYTRQHNSLIFGNIHVGLLRILDHLHPFVIDVHVLPETTLW